MLPLEKQEIIIAEIENKIGCQAMSTFKYYVTFLVFHPIAHLQKGHGRTRKGSREDNNSDQRGETASIRGTSKLLGTVQPGRDNLILCRYHGLEKVNSQWLFFLQKQVRAQTIFSRGMLKMNKIIYCGTLSHRIF